MQEREALRMYSILNMFPLMIRSIDVIDNGEEINRIEEELKNVIHLTVSETNLRHGRDVVEE